MGKGGSPPTETTSTVYQSQLPEYAKPYYMGLMRRGSREAGQGYTPYG